MAGALKLVDKGGVVEIAVKAVPNASRTQIVGLLGDALKIKVAQPPEGGKANAAVEAVLAETLGVAASQVAVVAGRTRPQKVVAVRGVAVELVRQKLMGA